MKRAVSVSLGSSTRDKQAEGRLGDASILIERRGTDGDARRARALFRELDGKVDALGLGGFEMYVRVENQRYPLRAGLGLVRDVRKSPVVDGGGLKQTLERRVFELAAKEMGGRPSFGRA